MVRRSLALRPQPNDARPLLAVEPTRILTLGWLAPDGAPEVTWTFVLDEIAPGTTRLLVRVRGGPGYRFRGLPLLLTRVVIRVVHFIMQRKQLLGIASRAESSDQEQRSLSGAPPLERQPGSSILEVEGE